MENKYDHLFIAANTEFFGGVFDWRWWKAQGIVESALNPKGESYCGAMGLMQIMKPTWDEFAEKLELDNPWDAAQNIRAGVHYMRRLWEYWRKRLIEDYRERLLLSFASYNAGMGNIKKAWDITDGDKWEEVEKNLHKFTGSSNSKQTIDYVDRIERIFNKSS